MFGLGYSPTVMNQLGVIPRVSSQFFSPNEQAYMETFFALTTDEQIQRKLDGLNDQVEGLRLSDSVNAKLSLLSVQRLLDFLDDEVIRLDEVSPGGAPHAVLVGPKFPRDSREVDIRGKILTVVGSKLTDHQGLFGDSYWESVGPEERLAEHEIKMLSGTAAGEIRQITSHVIRGTGAPYIVVDDPTDISPGDRFKVLEALIPQDNLDKRDRSTDWIVSTAIHGTFTNRTLNEIFDDDIFGDSDAYWDDVKKTLKGRTLTILEGAFAGDYLVTAHNIGNPGSIELEGDPAVAGTEQYSIPTLSPFENGLQKERSLRNGDPETDRKYDFLEPGTKRVLTSMNLPQVPDPETAAAIDLEMQRIDRYLRRRFHRWFGSHRRLRRFRKTAKRIERQFQGEADMHDDIEAAVIDLGLFVNIEEPATTLPPTIPDE